MSDNVENESTTPRTRIASAAGTALWAQTALACGLLSGGTDVRWRIAQIAGLAASAAGLVAGAAASERARQSRPVWWLAVFPAGLAMSWASIAAPAPLVGGVARLVVAATSVAFVIAALQACGRTESAPTGVTITEDPPAPVRAQLASRVGAWSVAAVALLVGILLPALLPGELQASRPGSLGARRALVASGGLALALTLIVSHLPRALGRRTVRLGTSTAWLRLTWAVALAGASYLVARAR